MLRGIINKVTGAARRPAAGATGGPRRGGVGGAGAGGSANGEIARGAKSVARGLSRKKRGR